MTEPFVRRDIWTLQPDDPTVVWYAAGIKAMRQKPETDPTSWSFQAAIHGSLSPSPRPMWNMCRHQSWWFLPWHRHYLYFFERIVRAEIVAQGGPSDWALPYWNYDGGSGHNALPLAFRGQTREDGSHNPLWAPRSPWINSGHGLPSQVTTASRALSRPYFIGDWEFGGGLSAPLDKFAGHPGRIELTPHNDVHSFIGGLMGDPATAAQDAIFWLHHANIDRLWWSWHLAHLGRPSDQSWLTQTFAFFDVDGTRVTVTDEQARDIHQLGYEYDTEAAAAVIPAAAAAATAAPAQWPEPWPQGQAAATLAATQPGEEQTLVRDLVGGADQPVTLTGQRADAPVTIDTRAVADLRRGDQFGATHHRAFLDLNDIQGERNPAVAYGVYVNLPDSPSQDDLDAHHVGNLSFFGIERARNPRGDEHAHGFHVSLEITDVLDRLAQTGQWQNGQQLHVDFLPLSFEPPDDQAASRDSGPAFETHEDAPVTIGSITVHFA